MVVVSVLQLAFISLVSLADSCSLRSGRILFGLSQSVGVLTVVDFAEGRGGVKPNRVRNASNSNRSLPNVGRYALNARRSVSIRYETLRTDGDFSGEDFQNRGTFIVVRSSMFAKSSAQNTHLARDAYNA
ncbi:MAG: hypothetical protein K0U86_21720 [Planctomycetes bacterium]|nr:hypothetical protein [Planctomycetota bacterium]MCH9727526.1 hypothetical protein [Planctomycetota bacterium]MCH9777492.1 hypothetical protein [Planctomycetota bacterium]